MENHAVTLCLPGSGVSSPAAVGQGHKGRAGGGREGGAQPLFDAGHDVAVVHARKGALAGVHLGVGFTGVWGEGSRERGWQVVEACSKLRIAGCWWICTLKWNCQLLAQRTRGCFHYLKSLVNSNAMHRGTSNTTTAMVVVVAAVVVISLTSNIMIPKAKASTAIVSCISTVQACASGCWQSVDCTTDYTRLLSVSVAVNRPEYGGDRWAAVDPSDSPKISWKAWHMC